MDEKEAMKQAAEKDAIEDNEMLIFQSGWKAALKWRDSQAGEPFAYFYHDAVSAKEANPISNSTLLVLASQRRVGFTNETPLYTTLPAAQINQQLVKAVEGLLNAIHESHCENSGAAQDAAVAALAAVKEQTK